MTGCRLTPAREPTAFLDAWEDCRRAMAPGWALHLVWYGDTTLAMAVHGHERRWAYGLTEAEALRALEAKLLDELAEVVR